MIRSLLGQLNNKFHYKIADICCSNGYSFILQTHLKNKYHKFKLKDVSRPEFLKLLHPVDIIVVGIILFLNKNIGVSLDFELLESIRSNAQCIIIDLKIKIVALNLQSNTFLISTTGGKKISLRLEDILRHYELLSLLPNAEKLSLGIILGSKVTAQ